jgi:hypothetical protein
MAAEKPKRCKLKGLDQTTEKLIKTRGRKIGPKIHKQINYI